MKYKGMEFEDKMYEQGDAPEYSREVWTKEKFTLGLDLPNVSYEAENFRVQTSLCLLTPKLGNGTSNDLTSIFGTDYMPALFISCLISICRFGLYISQAFP